MDLQKERDDAQRKFGENWDLMALNETELAKHPDAIQVKIRLARWKYVQFHDKVAHLALTGVIPKSIPKYFEDTFPTAVLFIDLAPMSDYLREHCRYLMQWCEQENIQKIKHDS